VIGLEPQLLELVFLPALIMALSPAIGVFVFFYRGVQVQQERTTSITRGVLVNVVTLLVLLFGGAALLPVPGVVTAAAAFVGAIFLEVLYLRYYANRTSLNLAEFHGR
jgi:nitrate reductase gamma subunit